MAEVGAPKGNQNAETHGLVTLRNQIKRRVKKGRSFIDRRSNTGRNALEAQAGLIADLGGERNITTAEKIMVELVTRDLWYLSEIDRRIKEVSAKFPKANNPKALHLLYSYRQPVVGNIGRNLTALGLQRKELQPKSLEDIFNEGEAEEETEGNDTDNE